MFRLLFCGLATAGLVTGAADCLAMGGGGNLSLERSPYGILLQAPTDARAAYAPDDAAAAPRSDAIKPARRPHHRRTPAAALRAE